MIEAGIAGLPNAGKTTLFNALTKANALCASYRFTTIKPNVGIAEIKDERLYKIAEVERPEKIINKAIKFIDVAGLIEGAHKGEGLGNQFLADIRTVDVICHCIRGFNLEGETEPNIKRDVEIINTEFIYSDYEIISRRIEKIEKKANSGDKQAKEELNYLEICKNHLEEFQPLRNLPEEIFENIKKIAPDLITIKPVVYVLNVEEPDNPRNESYVAQLKEISEREKGAYCIVAAKLELELLQIEDEAEREAMYKEFGLYETAVSQVASKAYQLGKLITFFTTANRICQAWELKKGSTAVQAAERIHTDIARGFIKAEVVNWKDLVEAGSWATARQSGKVLIEGKEYIVQDGDVINFRFRG